MAKKKWSDLSTTQQRLICLAGAVETALTVAALTDLAMRPATGVRGPKVVWALGCFVQPVGPISYFALGRRDG